MPSFLENFLAEAADRVAPDPGTGFATFLDNIVPDENNIPGQILTAPITGPVRLLQGAVNAAGFVDDALSRPTSTAIQSFTLSNPLYRDGIQFSDFVQMWNASSYISPGRAAMTSAFSPGSPSGGLVWALTGMQGNADWNEFSYAPGSDYNPYVMGEQATEDAWDNSVLGTIGSGAADIGWQLLAGKGVGAVAGVAKRAAGLSTSVRGVRDLQALNNTLDDHLKYLDTGGTEGKWSSLGTGVEDIANTRDFAEIYASPWLGRWTTPGSRNRTQLAYVLQGVDDPRLVKDILLADRGDYAAIGRLFQQAPDHVWTLTDMNASLRAKFIEGGQYHFTPDEATAVKQVFDSALERDEFFTAVRDLFMQTDEAGLMASVGRNADFIPMQGVAGRAQKWLYQNEMILRTGQTERWIARPLGAIGQSKPLVTFMQWVGGRRPLGYVSLSGLRPDEAVDEMLSYSASAKALRGNEMVRITQTAEDGITSTVDMTMGQWRNTAIGRLGQAKVRGGDTAVALEVRNLEAELVSAVANKYGIPEDIQDTIIRGFQDARDTSASDVARDGFWFDEETGLSYVNPVTRRQLADNLSLLPLGEIDRLFRIERANLIKAKAMTGAEKVAHGADFVLRVWRTNMLFKPGYTPKNAIFEPALASLLSHGSIVSPSGAMNAFNNFWINRSRQLRGAGYALVDRTGLSRLSRDSRKIKTLHNERVLVSKQLDDQEAFIQALESGNYPPSVARRWGQVAKDERRDLDRILAEIEATLDEVDPVWSQVREVPSFHSLSRRLDEVEARAGGSVDTLPLRSQLDEIRDQIESLDSVEATAQRLADRLAEIEVDLGILNQRSARARLKREAVRERSLGGDEDFTFTVGGEEITIPGLYNEGNFGTAIRAEASSATTNALTFDPNNWGGVGTGRWMRRGGFEAVDPSSPDYWAELAYIANRQVRGDKVAEMILEGRPVSEIMSWLRTPAGKKYSRGMGWNDGVSSRMWQREDEIVDRIRLINQYFPTEQSRARLLMEDDVTPAQMQELLGASEDLFPIHAGELIYSPQGGIKKAINNALNAIYRNLATKPEDRFGRFPWLDRQWRQNVQADARLLAEQGQELTMDVVNNLRAAATSRALKELDNTFYNIRRYSNPVFALRYITGFPGAYYNSLYRYAKLGYQNPGRALVMSNAYLSTYKTFGVDSEGNPTENWEDAQYFAFPVPEDVSDRLGIDNNVRVSTRTVDFITQGPTFLPHIMIPTSSLLRYKPTANEWMKQNLSPEVYRMFFPFDQPTVDNQVTLGPAVLDPMLAGWQMDMATGLSGIIYPTDEDFLQAAGQLLAYEMTMWEEGGRVGPMPKPEDAARDARNFFFGKSFAKFLGLSGFNSQPAGAALREEWYALREMYNGDTEAARAEYIRLHGESHRHITYSTSDYRVYMPATPDAYNRLNENAELANNLRRISPDEPDFVSLLFWGSEGNFDTTIYNWMGENSVPGDSEDIRDKLSPEAIADRMAIGESWDQYNKAKAKLDGLMAQYGYTQLRPDNESAWLYNEWQSWLNAFEMDDANAQWVADFGNFQNNKAELAIRGLSTLLADQSFMKKNAGVPGYQIGARYLENLARAKKAYQGAGTEERERLSLEWDAWVTQNLLPGDSNFAGFYTRFLQGKDLGL